MLNQTMTQTSSFLRNLIFGFVMPRGTNSLVQMLLFVIYDSAPGHFWWLLRQIQDHHPRSFPTRHNAPSVSSSYQCPYWTCRSKHYSSSRLPYHHCLPSLSWQLRQWHHPYFHPVSVYWLILPPDSPCSLYYTYGGVAFLLLPLTALLNSRVPLPSTSTD